MNQKTENQEMENQSHEQVQRLTKEEWETACVYNEADGFWEIYTGIQSHIRKFDKLNYPVTYIDYYPDGEVAGKFYKVPKNAITFRNLNKTRTMSEEEKKKKSQIMKELRQKQIESSNQKTEWLNTQKSL